MRRPCHQKIAETLRSADLSAARWRPAVSQMHARDCSQRARHGWWSSHRPVRNVDCEFRRDHRQRVPMADTCSRPPQNRLLLETRSAELARERTCRCGGAEAPPTNKAPLFHAVGARTWSARSPAERWHISSPRSSSRALSQAVTLRPTNNNRRPARRRAMCFSCPPTGRTPLVADPHT